MRLNEQKELELLQRILALEQIRKLDPTEVRIHNKNMTEEVDFGNGPEAAMDWEYCLFQATLTELLHTFTHFIAVERVKIKKQEDSPVEKAKQKETKKYDKESRVS